MRRHGGGSPGIWSTLGIEATSDVSAIRRAYAARLKQTHPEDDPAGFAALRAAYERAMDMAAPRKRQSDGVGPVRMSRKRQPLSGDAFLDWEAEDREPLDGPDEPIPPPFATEGEAGPAPAPEPAPPPPPPAPSRADRDWAEVGRQRGALVYALRSGNEAACLAALRALLRSPQMASLDIHGDNETWLSRLILRDGRGLEHIAPHVAAFFGWETDIRRETRGDNGLLWRLRELRFLSEVSAPGGQWSTPWKQLQAAPVWKRRLGVWLNPSLSGQVRKLLDRTAAFPAIRRRMDREAIDWWQQRLWRPALPAWGFWLIVLAAVVGGMSAIGEPAWVITGRALLCAAVMAAPFLVWLLAFAWPTQLWRRWRHRLPRWLHYGWAPTSLILIVLAAALPIHPAIIMTLIGLSALNAYWALITGWPGGELVAISRHLTIQRLAIALGNFPLFGFWIFMQPFDGGLETQLIATVAGAILVYACGSGPLGEAWDWTSPLRRGLVILAAVACVALANAIIWTPPNLYVWPYATALITIAILITKPPAERMSQVWRTARAWAVVVTVVAALATFATLSDAQGLMPLGTSVRAGVILLSVIVFFSVMAWWDPFIRRRRPRGGR